MSIVRENLMTRKGYTPYCGNVDCRFHMPRTRYIGGQFQCGCGWRSSFDDDFIEAYEAKWADPSPETSSKEADLPVLTEASLPTTSRLSQLEARKSCAASINDPSTLIDQPPTNHVTGWLPIDQADKGIAYIHALGPIQVGNSYPIWARDADGRVFECLWADDGKRAYWWDSEMESPVDPVEFMPHPLDPRFVATTEGQP